MVREKRVEEAAGDDRQKQGIGQHFIRSPGKSGCRAPLDRKEDQQRTQARKPEFNRCQEVLIVGIVRRDHGGILNRILSRSFLLRCLFNWNEHRRVFRDQLASKVHVG